MRGVPRALEEMPLLITKADFLDHLAVICVQMAGGMEVASMIVDLPLQRGSQDERLYAVWRSKLPVPDLQIAAARETATLLRQLAEEERILAARAAADRTKSEPTRG